MRRVLTLVWLALVLMSGCIGASSVTKPAGVVPDVGSSPDPDGATGDDDAMVDDADDAHTVTAYEDSLAGRSALLP